MPAGKPSRAPIDTSVVMPAAVLRESARSDAIHKQVYENPNPDEPLPDNQPLATPPPTPVPTSDNQPPLTATPAPTAGVIPDTAPSGQDSWENRYKAMKGRHDQLATTQHQMQQQIARMEDVIANFQAVQAPAHTAQAPAELAASNLVTAEERANYGDEFLDVVARRAREAIQPELTRKQEEIEKLQRQLNGVTGTVVQSARDNMYKNLGDQVPNWTMINENPEFLSWLALQDPYSGVTRQKLLHDAFGRNDTARVLSFFKGFLTEEAAVAPSQAPIAPAPTGGTDLAALAAPGRARSAAPVQNGTPDKPIITRAQIAGFYADVRAGRYEGSKEKEAEKVRAEQMIFDATRDKRIR